MRKKIISDYETSLKKGTVGETCLRKLSWLTASKGKIKHAYYTLIEQSANYENDLSNEEKLIPNYCQLSFFIEDAIAEKYAQDYDIWQKKKRALENSKKDEIFAKQYIAYTHMLKNNGLFEEINNYITELKKKA